MIKIGALVFFLFVATQAIAADTLYAITPSGTAEMAFPDKPQVTAGKISSKCMDVRWTVISSSNNEVTCEVPMTMGQSVLTQALLGNSYSTLPRKFVKFSLGEINSTTRVQASSWTETQMAFGQVQRADLSNSASFKNWIMLLLEAAGGSYPVGTQFPNHATLGVLSNNVQSGKALQMHITKVVEGSSAEKAGIQVGDIITSIAGVKFKDADDLLAARAKAAKTPTYPVTISRNGQSTIITVDREYRPVVTQALVATESTIDTQSNGIAPASIADELSKLLKLKEQGILTQAEFDVQKAKLLSR